ncbi:MAG TPA: DUF3313 domain-containing protein [Gammaproteobacteria bacterium]|nr:DUF3313 domain-containing protein [Gammaproteobacteria bacterium]
MKSTVQALTLMAAVIMVSALAGCSGSMHARNVDLKNAFLVNPSMYKEGPSDGSLYRYVKPGLDIKQYSKILVDPVLIVKEAELDEGQRENYQKLADNAYIYLTSELGNDYEIVKKPGPGAMRLQFAIIDADSSKPVRNLLSSASPIGIGVGAVTYGVTGKPSGVGEITVEMKVTDAKSGDLLGAALDRRVGDKNPVGIIDTWYNADEALQYWAKQIRFVLCRERGGAGCEKP